ncbi:site-specific integrase [Periweissella cryptocerci]|uniref:Site-specific integrase n=1 Tax=Periweissella cryptocerci TaxID=2506420 RepID=A0A4P6YSE0_9LACO|nr:site-specific integrase [Periweissella cryptocerci]QBO35542.1 site-specific integrase [Periweissella cryptocerci]
MTLYRKNSDGNSSWEFLELVLADEKSAKYQRRWHRGYSTRAKAVTASKQYSDDIRIPLEQVTVFSDLVQLWFDKYEAGVKGSTALRTRTIIENHLLQSAMLGDLLVTEITVATVQNVVDVLAQKLQKHNRCVYYLAEIFKFAVQNGIIESNPVLNISIPREQKVQASKAQYWEREQIVEFLGIVSREYIGRNHKIYIFFRLLIFTGMRKGELMALRWSDIDFDRQEVKISKTVSRDSSGIQVITSPKTEKANRIVVLDRETCRILREYRKVIKPRVNDLIVPNTEGKPLCMTKGDKWLKHIIAKYGLIPMTMHGFRHTFASLAKDAGLDELQVQYQLGHVDVKTTLQYYVHLTNRSKREGIKKFSHYINS